MHHCASVRTRERHIAHVTQAVLPPGRIVRHHGQGRSHNAPCIVASIAGIVLSFYLPLSTKSSQQVLSRGCPGYARRTWKTPTILSPSKNPSTSLLRRLKGTGSGDWIRTNDTRLMSPLLCQLSYAARYVIILPHPVKRERQVHVVAVCCRSGARSIGRFSWDGVSNLRITLHPLASSMCSSTSPSDQGMWKSRQDGGRVRQKRQPSPMRPELSAQMRPFMASTNCLQM